MTTILVKLFTKTARLKKLNYNKNIACFSKMRYHKRERIVYVGEKGIPYLIGNGKYGG